MRKLVIFVDAIIGHTGFVGQTLCGQRRFDACYNRANIGEMENGYYDTVVCAAAPGSMFEANAFPDRDAAIIDSLCKSLSTIKVRRFVLISTIAALARFDGRDIEDTTAFQQGTAYGRNRRRLEEACARLFDDLLIVRMPALFGDGLKKNFIFDLINPAPSMLRAGRLEELLAAVPSEILATLSQTYRQDPDLGLYVLDRPALDASEYRNAVDRAVDVAGFSAVNFTNPRSSFQFYDMSRLWPDISTGLENRLVTLHLATEPLAAARIHLALTGTEMHPNDARVHHEDMRTRHAALWGQNGPYIIPADNVLASLQAFYHRQVGVE